MPPERLSEPAAGGIKEWIADPQGRLALLTLTVLEIVLGIDNIVFLAVRLPEEQQPRARLLGLAAAIVMRILLLLSITWVMRLTVIHNKLEGRSARPRGTQMRNAVGDIVPAYRTLGQVPQPFLPIPSGHRKTRSWPESVEGIS